MSDYDVWVQARHDWDNDEWLERRPVCSICHEHIQDEHALHYDGEWICEECAQDWMQRFFEGYWEQIEDE